MNYEKEKSKYEKRYEEQMRELLVLTGEYVLNLTHKFIWISSCFYAILKKKR